MYRGLNKYRLMDEANTEENNATGASGQQTQQTQEQGPKDWEGLNNLNVNMEDVKKAIPLEFQSAFKDIKDIRTLFHNHAHLVKMMGTRINLPDDKTSAEDQHKFYTKLGKPDTPDGYELNYGDVKLDPEVAKSIKTALHSLNLTKNQADGVFKTFLKLSQDIEAEATNKSKAQEETQKVDFEKALGANKAEKLETFKLVTDKLPEFKAIIEKGKLSNNIEAVELALKLAPLVKEDMGKTHSNSNFVNKSKNEILKELGNDKDFLDALNGRKGPEQRALAKARFLDVSAMQG